MSHLVTTGTLSPDATGTYIENGTYNGSPAYEREDSAYWIWDNVTSWIISPTLGTTGNTYWGNCVGTLGSYDPKGRSPPTGVATVAAADIARPKIGGGLASGRGLIGSLIG